MNDKKNCKIVQDLFPSYIDNLTDIETNNFIKQHLEECDECKKLLEDMKESLSENTEKANKRDIKYMKKFNKKLSILLIIIYIIGIIIVASAIRKIVIVKKLSKAAESYMDVKNYHKIFYDYNSDGFSKFEVYTDGDNIKNVSLILGEDGTYFKETRYLKKLNSGLYSVNIYTEKDGKKEASLNNEINMFSGEAIFSPFDVDWTSNIFLDTIPLSIKSLKYNGRDCYYITNPFKVGMFEYYGNGVYFDKETGLPVCFGYYEDNYTSQSIIEYEFDCVTDKDFIEPDISEYELGGNNGFESIKFIKKFGKYSKEQTGISVKELLNVFVQNIDENGNDDTKLPDIIYIEENSEDTMKSKLTDKDNLLELDDISSKEVSYTEVFESSDGSFAFNYDKDSSFKIVSDSNNTNKNLILEMISNINDEDNYYICIAVDVDNDYTNDIDSIIINKR